jgi:hypothetical protein
MTFAVRYIHHVTAEILYQKTTVLVVLVISIFIKPSYQIN